VRWRRLRLRPDTPVDLEGGPMKTSWQTRLYAILRVLTTAGVSLLNRPKPRAYSR
jgi:hypothetical protein